MSARRVSVFARLLTVVAAGVLVGGCGYPDKGPPLLRIQNRTNQTLVVEPVDKGQEAWTLAPGETAVYPEQPENCESNPWIATGAHSEVVARIDGACSGHQWTILGKDNSTYR